MGCVLTQENCEELLRKSNQSVKANEGKNNLKKTSSFILWRSTVRGRDYLYDSLEFRPRPHQANAGECDDG